MRAVYAYHFEGTMEDLKVEEGEGAGFVALHIDELRKELTENPDKFTPFMLNDAGINLLDCIDRASTL